MNQIQAVNDLGDLLFAAFLLTTVILTIILAYRKLRGRRTRRLVFAIPACLLVYAAILVGVSLTSTTRELAFGTDKCFDDWCATVTGAESLSRLSASSGMKSIAIRLRISNRSRQAAFRPSQPRVTLAVPYDGVVALSEDKQREFERQAGPQESLAKRLVAGDTFQTMLVFQVPASTREASVILLEGPSLLTRFVIGDENSFLHMKMVYPIKVE